MLSAHRWFPVRSPLEGGVNRPASSRLEMEAIVNHPSSCLFPLALLLASCAPDPGETGFLDSEACIGDSSLCLETGAVDSGDGWDTQDQDVPSKATLDPAQEESIRAVVRRYNGQVKYCYDKSLAENPELQGRVEVYLELAEGRTQDTRIVYNTTGDTALGDCIRNKVHRWRFDSDIQAEVIYPFVLSL